ncbi:IS3 family transposase [Streptomyces sp. NPDC003554]
MGRRRSGGLFEDAVLSQSAEGDGQRLDAPVRAARLREDRLLAARIREVHGESGGAYGSPRVTAEFREKGLRVNEKRIAQVMRTFSITGIRLRRRVRTTIPDPAASQVPDLFQRDFTATGPGRKCMDDHLSPARRRGVPLSGYRFGLL